MEREDVERLAEIRDEMKELMTEARRIVERFGGLPGERAKCYWIPQIIKAIDTDHEFLGGSMSTLQYTIDELTSRLDEENPN